MSDGAADGTRWRRRGLEAKLEFGDVDWRARSENCASVGFLSPRYLKIIYLKRYVGGLVYFDGSTSVYRALRTSVR